MITPFKKIFLSVYEYFITHDMRHDSFMVSAFIGLILLFFSQIILLGVYYFSLPDVIVIHSNIYFGIDLIGERIYSGIIPIASVLVMTLHSIAVFKAYRVDRDLARLIMSGTLVVMLMLLVNIFFVIKLNI